MRPGSAAEHVDEITDLLVNLRWMSHGLRHLFPDEFAISLAQPENSGLHRTFGQPKVELLGYIGQKLCVTPILGNIKAQ